MDNNDEISIGDILRKGRSALSYILSKWILLLIVGILGGGIGYIIASYAKPKYKAELTFVLSTESKTSSFSGLASQFGLDLGGSSGNDVFSGDNILSLFKSRRMIERALFRTPPGEKNNLANIIVREWKWDKKWAVKERTKNAFPFPADATNLSGIQDSLLREIHTHILEECLSVARADKKLTIYSLSSTSTNQSFACYLTTFLMDESAGFYIDTKTSLAKKNLIMLYNEADSLRRLLGGTITSTAASVDRTFNLNPALQVQRSSIQKGQVNATVLGTAYGEVVKNLELAKIQLQKETPLYQVIDAPALPLKGVKISKTVAALMGAFAGIFVTIIIIFLGGIRRKRMRNLHKP